MKRNPESSAEQTLVHIGGSLIFKIIGFIILCFFIFGLMDLSNPNPEVEDIGFYYILIFPLIVGLFLLCIFLIKDLIKFIPLAKRMKKFKETGIFELDEQMAFLRVMDRHPETDKKKRYFIAGSIILSVILMILSSKVGEWPTHLSILMLICAVVYLVVYMFTEQPRSSLFKSLSLDRAELLASDINLDIPDFYTMGIHCGEKAFFAAKDHLLIAYEDVVWTYTEKRDFSRSHDINLDLIFATKDGCKHYVHYCPFESKHFIDNFIVPASPNLMSGYTDENVIKYKEIVKSYRLAKSKANKK